MSPSENKKEELSPGAAEQMDWNAMREEIAKSMEILRKLMEICLVGSPGDLLAVVQ